MTDMESWINTHFPSREITKDFLSYYCRFTQTLNKILRECMLISRYRSMPWHILVSFNIGYYNNTLTIKICTHSGNDTMTWIMLYLFIYFYYMLSAIQTWWEAVHVTIATNIVNLKKRERFGRSVVYLPSPHLLLDRLQSSTFVSQSGCKCFF